MQRGQIKSNKLANPVTLTFPYYRFTRYTMANARIEPEGDWWC